MLAPIPERIIDSASRRVAQSTPVRNNSIEKIEHNRPLDAEKNLERKVLRIEHVTGLSRGESKSLATYRASPADMGLASDKLHRAERILGIGADFVGVAFLELATAAAKTVGRVTQKNNSPWGTGFLVSDRLFLTNNHVVNSPESARNLYVEFEYELDSRGQPKQVTRFAFAPEDVFITSEEDDLDFTLIAIGSKITGPRSLAELGFCPLSQSMDKHTLGEYVNIVQHPDGRFKELVLRENRIVWRSDNVLHYVADTEPGASGAAVFNDQWEAVALHHWGGPHRDLVDGDGRQLDQEINEGIRISAVVKSIASRTHFDGRKPEWVRSALETWSRNRQPLERKPPQPTPIPNEVLSSSNTNPHIGQDGSVTWTIPLTVSVSLGQNLIAKTPAASDQGDEPADIPVETDSSHPQFEFESEGVKIDENYDNRKGYSSTFLDGFDIPLPILSSRHSPAPRTDSPHSSKEYILDYEHFSVVLNKRRRMAYYTAVNIDGKNSKSVNRKTGKVRENAEASEVWSLDPRVAKEHQTDQALYSNQQPRLFDRGHLVRREDPNWGSNTAAERANADTFHFSNCTPQASTFNQRAQYWQGIENYILNNARNDKKKVSVFTGPVLSSKDPGYRYIKVPRQFWKVCVLVDKSKLKVIALIADQSEMISRMPEHAGRIDESAFKGESFDDLGDVAQYQTTVAEIERLTGLKFGALKDHDTAQHGGESASFKKRISSFQDIQF